VGGWLESKLSDQLWLSFSLALAKPNKKRSSSPNNLAKESIVCLDKSRVGSRI
jgi:hypothetical protein